MRRTHLRLSALTAAAVLAAATPAVADAAPGSGDAAAQSWTSALAGNAPHRVNTVTADGAVRIRDTGWHGAAAGEGGYASVLVAAHTLQEPADTVRASATGDTPPGTRIDVDVRGRRDGRWTAWQPGNTAHFGAEVRQVQARVTLTTHGTNTPAARRIRFTARDTGARTRSPEAAVTAHVFATREGLVGGTTANGHVITADDHFVALPSRRGLSPAGSTDYSVKVCNPANGTCLTQPVWDVGPWNTHDDYWSPSDVRENWSDLPQGTPEAQAAYANGYNGGKDEFGRAVANPAGIDLADGTFADLGLTDNGYVDVTYLWTA